MNIIKETKYIMIEDNEVPKFIIIVPYRNREKELQIFRKSVNNIKEQYPNLKVLYIHQCDNRNFNRGAMKNIGFLVVKSMYPQQYHDINLIFHDVDIAPKTNTNINYQTKVGEIKHFYGYKHTLGGIISVKSQDFEKVNGFANFWTWGFEDRIFQERIEKMNININRDDFFEITKQEEEITDSHYILSPGTNERFVSKYEYNIFRKRIVFGIDDIQNLKYNIEDDFINVTQFNVSNPEPKDLKNYEKGNWSSLKNIVSKKRGKPLIFK